MPRSTNTFSEWRDFIQHQLVDNNITQRELLRLLHDNGVQISLRTLERRLAEWQQDPEFGRSQLRRVGLDPAVESTLR